MGTIPLISLVISILTACPIYQVTAGHLITVNTVTVIDNIFSNNLQDDITSGNVLLSLSNHFSQIISVKRQQIDCFSERLLKVLK